MGLTLGFELERATHAALERAGRQYPPQQRELRRLLGDLIAERGVRAARNRHDLAGHDVGSRRLALELGHGGERAAAGPGVGSHPGELRPGSTSATWIPNGRTSCRRVSIRPSTANLLALYCPQ